MTPTWLELLNLRINVNSIIMMTLFVTVCIQEWRLNEHRRRIEKIEGGLTDIIRQRTDFVATYQSKAVTPNKDQLLPNPGDTDVD